MEAHVIVEKLCSCAKKQGIEQIVTYDNQASAKTAASDQLVYMKNTFCGKHHFDITEVDGHFVIGMVEGGCGCGTHEHH